MQGVPIGPLPPPPPSLTASMTLQMGHLSRLMNLSSHVIVTRQGHSGHCTFCGCGQMYGDMCLSSQHHTEEFHCPQTPWAPPVRPSPSPSPGSHLRRFPRLPRVAFFRTSQRWNRAACGLARLASLSHTHFRFIHVSLWLDSPFVHSPIEGHVGCLGVWQV